MIGSLFYRVLVMTFGYLYPAYECYKTVEKNKGDIQQLRFWCQYWILVAVLTVWERIGDTFVSWLPMYDEAKLALVIYLWYPKTKGTEYVYDSFFRPYLRRHETDIDRAILELKTKAGDKAAFYYQMAGKHAQARVSEILLFVASLSSSTSKTEPSQVSHQHLLTQRSQRPQSPSSSSGIGGEEKNQNEAKPAEPAQDTEKKAVHIPTHSTPGVINTAGHTEPAHFHGLRHRTQ